jgi:hypothetical protein
MKSLQDPEQQDKAGAGKQKTQREFVSDAYFTG